MRNAPTSGLGKGPLKAEQERLPVGVVITSMYGKRPTEAARRLGNWPSNHVATATSDRVAMATRLAAIRMAAATRGAAKGKDHRSSVARWPRVI
jgi:hypothetical protein